MIKSVSNCWESLNSQEMTGIDELISDSGYINFTWKQKKNAVQRNNNQSKIFLKYIFFKKNQHCVSH